MKTAVARIWQSLDSKLHPPLPMTPRESRRLLSLLNASFKQQLDREYPNQCSSNEQHANLHLQSILKNPLFDRKHRTRARSNSQSHNNGQCLGQKQDYMKNPMDVFKERVSQGNADLEIAKFCLGVQYKACLASPAATPKEAMQSSGAASTILEWLWSSGMEDTGTFLNDPGFVVLLVPFLVAEGHQSRISRWLQRCNCLGEPAFSSLRVQDNCRVQRLLFAKLIVQEMRNGEGLESAISVYLRIVTGLLSAEGTKDLLRRGALEAAWILTTEILRLPEAAESESPIINAFANTTRRLRPGLLQNAILCLYMQKRPDPQPALTLFQKLSARASARESANQRPCMALVGLKAADLFLQDGRQSEALWIMDFLQENFAQEIGSQLPQGRNRSASFSDEPNSVGKDEERNLHLLDTLTVQ